MSPRPLHIAVLGDLHGHFTLAYRILRRWERAHQNPLDLVLQVGDLGAFPPPFRLDKATARFAERDPDELGFAVYYNGDPEADEVLGPYAEEHRRFRAPMVFIKGNHEDFDYLESLVQNEDGLCPTDPYEKILYLRSGQVFTFSRDGISVRIAGLGGISEQLSPGNDPRSEFYTRGDVKKLQSLREIDVFLSHEPALGSARTISPNYQNQGSHEAWEFLERVHPRYYFCGHYHEDGRALHTPTGTQGFMLNAVNFLKAHRFNPGCMGILRWGPDANSSFQHLNDPWLREYSKSNYRHL